MKRRTHASPVQKELGGFDPVLRPKEFFRRPVESGFREFVIWPVFHHGGEVLGGQFVVGGAGELA